MPVLGRISTPPLEILASRNGSVTDARSVVAPRQKSGFFRMLRGARNHAYVVGAGSGAHAEVDADSLGGLRCFALIEHDREGRPCLNLLSGMKGVLEIGVCRVRVEQLLADPALRQPTGHVRYPLPNGIRARLHVGETRFDLSLGGGSLEPLAATSTSELSTASLRTAPGSAA